MIVTRPRAWSIVGSAVAAPQGRPSIASRRQIAGRLAALVAVTAMIQVPRLPRAYWVDEGITVGLAGHSLAQIPGLLRLDGSPPLYYALLHIWMWCFGTTPVATHMLSLLLAGVAVPLAYWAGCQVLGVRTGWCAAALVAVNPLVVWYGTETRMYALVVVLALAGVALAIRADARGDVRSAVQASLVFVLLLYTHNWSVYLLASTAAALGSRAIARRDGRRVAQIAVCLAAIGLCYLPWLPSLLEQARTTAAPWAVAPQVSDLIGDPSRALLGSSAFGLVPVVLALLLFAGWRGRLVARTWNQRTQSTIVALLTVGGLTVVLGWIGSQLTPSWALRYLAVAVPPLIVAIAGALAGSRGGRWAVGAVCTVVGAFGVAQPLTPAGQRYVKSNAAAVAHVARAVLRPGDVVVVTQAEQVPVMAHYLPRTLTFLTPAGAVPDPAVVDWRQLVKRLTASTPCTSVNPALASLPVGATVLLVNPLQRVGAKGSAWYSVVNGQVDAVTAYLRADPAFRADDVFAPGASAHPYSGVTGELFRKVSSFSSC